MHSFAARLIIAISFLGPSFSTALAKAISMVQRKTHCLASQWQVQWRTRRLLAASSRLMQAAISRRRCSELSAATPSNCRRARPSPGASNFPPKAVTPDSDHHPYQRSR